MARRTPLDKAVTRNAGDHPEFPDHDLVATLDPDGPQLILRAEPRLRRIGRGEHLPEVRFRLEDLVAGSKKTLTEDDIEEKLQHALRLIRISHLGDAPKPSKIRYKAKLRMLEIFKEVFDMNEEQLPTIEEEDE